MSEQLPNDTEQASYRDMTYSFQKFGVLGAGAWGTALALTLRRSGRDVVLWAHNPDLADTLRTSRENSAYLKTVAIDAAIQVTDRLDDLVGCEALVMVTPAQHLRETLKKMVNGHLIKFLSPQVPIIIASKGIELNSGALLDQVVADEVPTHPIAVLSGPSFAIEVAKGLPAALTLAIKDQEIGSALQRGMVGPTFRLYLSDDLVGAQLGGAIKNVLAVACGIVMGRRLGENARAALMTRGLAEMMRLGVALGARMETFMGLSGLGDLTLTCASFQSRNMSLGQALGQGEKLASILATRHSVAEGVTTAAAAHLLAQKLGIEMPIVAGMDAILNERASIDDVITGLLARPLKAEGH